MKSVRFLSATALASASFVVPHVATAQATPTREQCAANPNLVGCAVSADGEVTTSDAIVVTGSRIPRPEFSGNLPGAQVDAQQIQTRGFTNALDIVNDVPLTGPGSTFNGNNGGQAASLGSAFIDLLDLGTSRTLTLVNGRRFVAGNAATLFVDGNSTGSQVDVNVIPVALVDRVDVLTVGGAAAYGSDAIAGVVNYVLRSDFEGTQFTGIGRLTSRGDGGDYTLRAITGFNALDGRLNLVLSGEYNHFDGIQADARDFRLRRATTIANYANGSARNRAFAPAIIDVVGSNNGAFLRNTDDGLPATQIAEGLINQGLSFNGTVFTLPTSVPARQGLASTAVFFNTASQIVNGLPGVPLTLGSLNGNGLNGRTTPIANLPITTFAPTAIPTGVTAAQIFTQFGVTPPAGATTTQLNTLAINVLQANRPTAREFFTTNPNVPTNYFLGTFFPQVPRTANTDTSLVTIAGVQVPVNQVLPFVAVPLEFNDNGSLRAYTAATLTPTTPGLLSQAPGSNGGFTRAIENIVLRTQQDRYVANLIGSFKLTDEVSLFTENLYSRVQNIALRNSPSQNFISTGAENTPLQLNVSNPYLTQQNRDVLASVGITATAPNNGNFLIARQNQDIFGDNPFRAVSDTVRSVLGLRVNSALFGRDFKFEVSGTYGRSTSEVQTSQIKDLEYILAIDTARDASGTIRCSAQLNPAAYLGTTPVGIAPNLTRQPGAGGIPTEVVITPTITQAMIDSCTPMNPFGYNQMSEASKNYVKTDVLFRNVSEQIFLQGSLATSPFDLPGGPLGVALSAEYRNDKLDFQSDPINQLGRGRSAPSAQTAGQIRVWELGAEARIPVFGNGFGGFLGDFEINPAARFTKQSGSSATYRNLAGQIVTPTSTGKFENIWSIAATWRPIRDITFRGNITRSLRQPSVVELFLGGQPAFAAPTDPCGPANIAAGASATARRANCRAAVIAAGLAPDATTADAFLATFVPNTAALPGSFAGAPGLKPERGKSYTFGAVLTPTFIPGLQISGDYISLDLSNIIQPTSLAQALQFCYESATFPDTTPQTGANACSFFTRNNSTFQVAPGFGSGFINLSATQIRAFNFALLYKVELPSKLGRLNLRSNVYHLRRFTESAAGTFTDAIESAGTFNRPKWEGVSSIRYEKGIVYSQLTWRYQSKTNLFTNGAPSTIENFPNVRFRPTNVFDLTLGADITEQLRIQGLISNVTDELYAGENGLFQGAYVDQIGRRFQISVSAKF